MNTHSVLLLSVCSCRGLGEILVLVPHFVSCLDVLSAENVPVQILNNNIGRLLDYEMNCEL